MGRETELEEFRAALDEQLDDVVVLALHGPGGIGKSALLRRYAIEATHRGCAVVEVDAGMVEPTEEAFAAAATVTGGGRVILLVDAADSLAHLEDWFRKRFLLSLAPGSVVVLAGRRPPSLRWRSDPEWGDSLRVRQLGGLSPAESLRVVSDAMTGGIAGRGARIAFADGHPLALRLAGRDDGLERGDGWSPSPAVVGELLRRVVGSPPSAAHRRALEICAHVPDATEDLLSVFMPDRAYEVFDWLRRQPYVSTGANALRLLPVVAEAVNRDLRWRAPDAYLSLHKAVRTHVQDLVRSRPEPESLRAAAAFNHVQARGRWAHGFDWGDRHDSVYETPCDAEGIRAIRDLSHEALGADGLATVDFWLHRQPEGFHLYRSAGTDEVVGVLGLLRFDRWDAVETVIDPVVRAVRDHVESEAGTGLGQRADLVRFMLVQKRSTEGAAVLPRMLARITKEVLSQERLDWTFVAVSGNGRLRRLLEYADFRQLRGTLSWGDHGVTIYGHDWRTTGVSEWAELLDVRMLSGSRAPRSRSLPRAAVLSRASFDDAVHDALRAWHQRDRLAANPLLRAAFVAQASGDPEQVLRRLIVRAVEAIDHDPKAKGQRAAVWATYLKGGSTQQAVARELSVSFSTYRRYLKRGVERVCWYLWEQERTYVAQARSGRLHYGENSDGVSDTTGR
ncbi:hypothetical protein [Streptomyces sp. NPDC048521]|uniref:hypothetical protein n=1 Tax=Streptomyces sp. NPDC048521 TaxID=3365566 RepID=UPI00371EFE70